MYKLFALLPMIFAAASAGYLNAAPLAYSAVHAAPVVQAAPVYHAAPVVQAAPVYHAAPVAVKAAVPVATSYANTYKVDVKAAPVVAAYAAPTIVKAAPVAYAAPTIIKSAPVAYAAPAYVKAAPFAYSAPALIKAPIGYSSYIH